MVQAHEATVGHNEDDGGEMWSKRGRSAAAGPGAEVWSSHRMSWLNSDPAGRKEREIGGTGEEPLDGAASDLDTRVCRREGPPWLPLGRVEREGVETAAPTMAGEWWRE
jgi:hypothetical protein